MPRFKQRKRSGDLKGEGSAQVVDITAKTSVPLLNDKIPEHVWNTLHAAGEVAATKLLELLNSKQFHTLRGSEQANLIRLAFEYSYGKPDAPIKRSITASLTGQVSDEVSDSLSRMASVSTLPEYRGKPVKEPILDPVDPFDVPLPPNDENTS